MSATLTRAAFSAGLAATVLLPRTVAAQTPVAVKVGTTGSDTYSEVFYAAERGYFKEAGLDVDIQMFNNGSAGSAAVASGAVDISVSSPLQIAQAVARGVPFVIIAAGALNTEKEPSAWLCVAGASPLRNPKDFVGKTVAVNGLKTASEEALDAWLGASNVPIAAVKTIEMSFSEMGAALTRGTVDAAILAEPSLTVALHNGVKIVASPTVAIAKQYLLSSWFSTREYAQKNPDAIKRFANAIYTAGRWANGHRSESALILAKHAKLDVDTTQAMHRVQYGEAIRIPEIQSQIDVAFKYGMIARDVQAREVLLG